MVKPKPRLKKVAKSGRRRRAETSDASGPHQKEGESLAFESDPLDHAETELRAYRHISGVLKLLAKHFAVKPKDLKIWDPYFCKGSVVKHLAHLGFRQVRNVNEDFYKVQEGKLPEALMGKKHFGSFSFCSLWYL